MITIKANGLYTQNSHFPLVENIDLCFDFGKLISIIGPSGSGKTTLLRALMGDDTAKLSNDGLVKYNLDGKVLTPKMACATGMIGALMPGADMVPWQRVIDNIRLPSRLNPKLNPPQEKEILTELIALDLDHEVLTYRPYELSFGMRQRIALATALLYKPFFLLLDEALNGLDLATSELVATRLKRYIEEQKAVGILITHDVDIALTFCNSIMLISKKKHAIQMMESGVTHEIIKSYLLTEIE